MNTKKLEQLYKSNSIIRGILNFLAERKQNSNVISLKRIRFHLKNRDVEVVWEDLVKACRALEDAGCGVFIRGSRGYPSRFAWEEKTTLLLDYATGAIAYEPAEADADEDDEDVEEDNEGDEEEEDDESGEEDDNLTLHTYVLRPELVIHFILPTDLTKHEANRLSQFVDSLSFIDPYSDEDEVQEDNECDDKEIDHFYILRRDESVIISLPADLTPQEANRISQFVDSLSFED